MCKVIKACAILVLAGLIFSIQTIESRATSSTKITGVKISEDLRRVIVKANGPLSPVHSGRLESPSRLAIQVPDAYLGDVDHTISNPDNSALLVRVSSSGSGVQLVLDFGKVAVPDYRMRLMDDCLIVLLGSTGTHPADARQPPFSCAAGAARSQPPHAAQSSRHMVPITARDCADLRVCSAEVLKGKVVVHVASRKHPDRTYRVDLGLSLDDLGFQSATICRVRERSAHPQRATGTKSSTVAATGLGMNRTGPAPALSATKLYDKPPLRRVRELTCTQAPSVPTDHNSAAKMRFGPVGSIANAEPRYQDAKWTDQQ